MKCPNCGTENPGGSKFCGSCGAEIERPSSSASESQRKPRYFALMQRATRWSHSDIKEATKLGDFAPGTMVRVLEEDSRNPNIVKVTTEDDIGGWISRASLIGSDGVRPRRYKQHAPGQLIAEEKEPGQYQTAVSGSGMLPLLIAICAAIAAIGSFGPWATTVFGGSLNGSDRDGRFTIFLAVIAGIGALHRAGNPGKMVGGWTALVCLTLAGFVGFIDAADISGKPIFELGWGLVILVLSSIAGAILSIILLIQDNNRINN